MAQYRHAKSTMPEAHQQRLQDAYAALVGAEGADSPEMQRLNGVSQLDLIFGTPGSKERNEIHDACAQRLLSSKKPHKQEGYVQFHVLGDYLNARVGGGLERVLFNAPEDEHSPNSGRTNAQVFAAQCAKLTSAELTYLKKTLGKNWVNYVLIYVITNMIQSKKSAKAKEKSHRVKVYTSILKKALNC